MADPAAADGGNRQAFACHIDSCKPKRKRGETGALRASVIGDALASAFGDYAQGTSGTPSQVDVPVGNVAVPLYEVRAPPSVQP